MPFAGATLIALRTSDQQHSVFESRQMSKFDLMAQTISMMNRLATTVTLRSFQGTMNVNSQRFTFT
ncbi:hypothetical protein CKO25_20755 [Thiocapsa imhoffii]|uniref:Uncharacterized protein n=1 Tax=Thiocapsa imhoffii TaxID=382777 RepID=A0A9X0WLJ8_9GAMM|nr:hypothetical protein [Thiocapsa imhoffii]